MWFIGSQIYFSSFGDTKQFGDNMPSKFKVTPPTLEFHHMGCGPSQPNWSPVNLNIS